MNEEYLSRIADALERRYPAPPLSGLHFFDPEVKERAISVRSTQGGKSVLEWTKSGDSPQTPILGVNAITGRIYSVKWNLKPTRRGNQVVDVENLMVGVEVSATERYVLRSGVATNFGYQLLSKLHSLPRETVVSSKFRIVAAANDSTKTDPKTGMTYLETVFCRLYLESGEEVKADYDAGIKNDVAYLIDLADRLGSYFNASSSEGVAGEDEDHIHDLHPPSPVGKTQPAQSSLVNEQILAEYARLKLAVNPGKGKELIQKRFGAEATHKSLTPDQKVEWLEILKKEKVESEPVPEITPEVVEEVVAEDIAEDVTPEPVEVETGSIPDEAFRDLTTQITVRETELKLAKLQIRGIIQANFGKVARVNLTDREMLTYLDVLNALEVRQ